MRRKVLAVALFSAVLLLACSLSSVIDFAKQAEELAPTAKALATQVGPTVQAAMTQVGPTVQGAMTQAAAMGTQKPGAQGQGGASANPMNWRPPAESTVLHSFHQEMVVHVKVGNGQDYDLFKIEGDYIRGQARRETISQRGGGTMEIVSIGNTTWYRAGKTWITLTDPNAVKNPESLVTGALAPEMADTAHWKANGTATVDGMKVYRYTYKAAEGLAGIGKDWMALLLDVPQLTGATEPRVTHLQGEVGVLQDGTIVKSFYQVQGTVKKDGQQVPVEVTVTTVLSRLNGDIQITPPPAATANAKAPVPLPPGATLEMQMGTSSIYTVPDMTVAQVMQFFDQAFAQQGYKVTTKVGDDQNGWTLQVLDPQGHEHLLMVAAENGKVGITIVK